MYIHGIVCIGRGKVVVCSGRKCAGDCIDRLYKRDVLECRHGRDGSANPVEIWTEGSGAGPTGAYKQEHGQRIHGRYRWLAMMAGFDL